MAGLIMPPARTRPRVVLPDIHCLALSATFTSRCVNRFRVAHVVENFKTFRVAVCNPFIPGALEKFFKFEVSAHRADDSIVTHLSSSLPL